VPRALYPSSVKPESRGKKERTSVLAPLTSFRFFAALAIVVFHTLTPHAYFLRSGVSFFYILSGFILTYVHPNLSGKIPTLRFWANRIARIWPLHLLTLALCVFHLVPTFSLGKFPLTALLLNMFLLQAWIPLERVVLSYNSVSWSISVEMFLYLLFPFLLPLVKKAPGKIVISAIVLTLLLAVSATKLDVPGEPYLGVFDYSYFAFFSPILNLYKFVLGMAVAVWWMESPKLPAYLSWTWIEFITFVGVIVVVPLSEYVAGVLTGWQAKYEMQRQLQDLMCVPFFGLLIYVFAFQKSILAGIMSRKWLVYLGDISFTVYMIQSPVKALIHLNVDTLSVQWLLYVAALIICSGLIHALFEKPARRFFIQCSELILKSSHLPKLQAQAGLLFNKFKQSF